MTEPVAPGVIAPALMRLIEELLPQVRFPAYVWEIAAGENGGARLRAFYFEDDADHPDGAMRQNTRWWVVSRWAIRSEIVQTAFKCILTSHEHRVREHFTYRGRAVFGPHFDVDALYAICAAREVRPPKEES